MASSVAMGDNFMIGAAPREIKSSDTPKIADRVLYSQEMKPVSGDTRNSGDTIPGIQ
jgi:hypothetical protein